MSYGAIEDKNHDEEVAQLLPSDSKVEVTEVNAPHFTIHRIFIVISVIVLSIIGVSSTMNKSTLYHTLQNFSLVAGGTSINNGANSGSKVVTPINNGANSGSKVVTPINNGANSGSTVDKPINIYAPSGNAVMACSTTTKSLGAIPNIIQYKLGFVKQATPLGAAILGDRGQLGVVRADPSATYDYVANFKSVVDEYDSMIDVCLADSELSTAAECQYSLLESVDIQEYIGTTSIQCIETCVESRLDTLEPASMDFSLCTDPVETAFPYAPELIKSCLDEDYVSATATFDAGCYSCISECLLLKN